MRRKPALCACCTAVWCVLKVCVLCVCAEGVCIVRVAEGVCTVRVADASYYTISSRFPSSPSSACNSSRYVASKCAILGLTVSSAKDLAPFNIRVNAVSPALIGPGFMWDRQNELHAAADSPYFDSDPAVVGTKKIGSVPMKRLGSIDEVIKGVAHLLSDDASYSTATNLVIAGGMA